MAEYPNTECHPRCGTCASVWMPCSFCSEVYGGSWGDGWVPFIPVQDFHCHWLDGTFMFHKRNMNYNDQPPWFE